MNNKSIAVYSVICFVCLLATFLVILLLEENGYRNIVCISLGIISAIFCYLAISRVLEIQKRIRSDQDEQKEKLQRDILKELLEEMKDHESNVEIKIETVQKQLMANNEILEDLMKENASQHTDSLHEQEIICNKIIELIEQLQAKQKEYGKEITEEISALGKSFSKQNTSVCKYLKTITEKLETCQESFGAQNTLIDDAGDGIMEEIKDTRESVLDRTNQLLTTIETLKDTCKDIQFSVKQSTETICSNVEEISDTVEKCSKDVNDALENHSSAYRKTMEDYVSVTEKDAKLIEKVFETIRK